MTRTQKMVAPMGIRATKPYTGQSQHMTHAEKVEYLLNDLCARGVNPYTVAPPLYRFLWRLGWEVKPPLFQGFATLFLGMGGFFGIAFGLAMWIMMCALRELLGLAVIIVVVSGLLFGLAMATCYRREALRLELSEWDRYPDA